MAKFKKITTEELDRLYKKFVDAFSKDKQGIMDTNVAKMMTRKEAGNFPSIGSRMTNPANLDQYAVPNISAEKRFFKLKEYERDLLNELIRARKYMKEGNIVLPQGSDFYKNFEYNMDLLTSVQKTNATAEAKFLKEGRNLNKILETEQSAVKKSDTYSEMSSIENELQSVKKKAEELKKMADDLVDMSAPKDEVLDMALKGIRTQRDGTYRAIARQILLRDPRLRLPENIRKSLDNFEDLNPSTRKSANDPIEVMRKYYGENMQYLDEWMDDAVNAFPQWENAVEAADAALVKISGLKPKPEVTKGLSESLQDIVKPLDEPKDLFSADGTLNKDEVLKSVIDSEDITGGKGKFFDVNETGPADLEAKFFDKSGKMKEEGQGIVEKGLEGLEKTNDIEKAVSNVEQNFASGDLKYNADVLADELALQRGLIKEGQDLTDLDQRDGMALYDEAYSWLSNQFMKARRAKKEYEAQQAKPKKDNVQSIYASQKEFDEDLYSITQNLIKNDPRFNIEIAKDFYNPGAKTYGWTPDGDKSKLLNVDQRQKVLDRIRDVLKDEEYMQRFGGDFDFSEISDEIFVIPRDKKPK